MVKKTKVLHRPIRESPGKILVSNHQHAEKIDLRLLKKIGGELLAKLNIRNAELEINLVDAREMSVLNWKFLKHEGSTDVIAFDYAESRNRKGISGEIFISVDDAIAQAKKFKTSWQSEITRYLVHGVLHLFGRDDLRPDLRRRMKREENQLLRALSRKFSLAQIAGHSKISS